MGFVDGAGSATWSGFRWDASGAVAAVSVVARSPKTGVREPSLGVVLSFTVDSTAGVDSDVQVQVATDAAFTNLIWTTTLLAVPNSIASVQPTGLADGSTYYWRARGAQTGTTGWGPWSGTPTATFAVGAAATGITATSSGAYASTAADAFTEAGINYGSAPPAWSRAQFAADTMIVAYQFRARSGELPDVPSTWQFQGSADGTTWNVLDSRSGITWTDLTPKQFVIAAPVAYRYYRLYVTAVPGGGGSWVTLAGLTLFGPGATSTASTPWTFTVDLNSGKAFGYSVENVGAMRVTVPSVAESIEENVGFTAVLYPGALQYVDENTGFTVALDPDAVEYVDEGDVSTNTPTPHVWWLEPTAGRPSDGVQIVGLGFGDLPSTYGGVVEMFYGGARGWENLPILTWQTFPPSAAAYGPGRTIDEVSGVMDPQHQIIEFTIPLDAESPGYPIRVRTEGP